MRICFLLQLNIQRHSAAASTISKGVVGISMIKNKKYLEIIKKMMERYVVSSVHRDAR